MDCCLWLVETTVRAISARSSTITLKLTNGRCWCRPWPLDAVMPACASSINHCDSIVYLFFFLVVVFVPYYSSNNHSVLWSAVEFLFYGLYVLTIVTHLTQPRSLWHDCHDTHLIMESRTLLSYFVFSLISTNAEWLGVVYHEGYLFMVHATRKY